MATKVCGSCKQELPTDHFHVRNASVDGLCSKCKTCSAIYLKKYREKNLESLNAKKRAYAQEHRAEAAERHKKWRHENKEHYNKKQAEWARNHPEWKRCLTRKRYALLKNSSGSHSADQIQRIYARQNNQCNYCGKGLEKGHVDHIIPITRGGTNYAANLQILCVSCNTSKSNKMPWEYFGWV